MAVSLLYAAAANSSFSSDTAPGNTQQSIARPGAIVDGSYMIIVFNVAPPGTNLTATMTPASGWNLVTSGVKTGSPTTQLFVYAKFVTSADTGPFVFSYSLASNVISQVYGYSGVDPTTPFADGGWLAQAASGTSRVTPTITLTADRFMLYGTHDRNASDPAVPSPDTATKLRNFQSSSVSLVTAQAGLITSGTSFVRTMTGAAATSVAGSFAFGLTPASAAGGSPAFSGAETLSVVGVAADMGTPAFSGAGTLSVAGGAPAASGAPAFSGVGTLSAHATSPVDKFLARPTMYVAHRGGSADWPEETLYSYAQAAAWNADMALEISMWQSLDGVWVASHDRTTGRVFSGTSYDIPTTRWDTTLQFLTSIVGGKPIARVDDILNLYANGDRVIFVDDKNGQDETGFYAMLASFGGPDRFVIKAAGTASSWAPTASSRGYQSWGYFYHTDYANVPTLQALWTMLGMDVFTGDSADWSRIESYGKPVLAHIISTAAQKATAAAFSPNGYMAAGVTEVVPQTMVLVSFSGVGTMGVIGKPGGVSTPTFSGVGTLSVVSAPKGIAAPSFSGAGTLTVGSVPKIPAAPAFSGVGTLTVVGSPPGSGTPAFSGAGTLSVVGKPSVTVSAGFSGVGTLTVIGGRSGASTPAFSGVGTLTVAALPAFTGAPAFSGAGTLTLSSKPSLSGAPQFSGVGTLTVNAGGSHSSFPQFSGVGTLTVTSTNGQYKLTVTTRLSGSQRFGTKLGTPRVRVRMG